MLRGHYETAFHIRFYSAVIQPHEAEVNMEILLTVKELAAALKLT